MADWEARVAWRLFHLNWIPIAAMGGILLLATVLTDFSVEPMAFGVTAAIAAFLGLTAYLYAFAKADLADPKLIFALGTISQILLVTAIVGPLSYVAGATNWPLQDSTFLAIDRALGMDPEPIARFVNDHRWLARCLESGYGLIKWPLLGIPIILTMSLRLLRLQQFTLSLSLALAITIAISALVPAIGTYYGLNVSPSSFPSVNTLYAAQLRDILALREGSLRHLELYKLAGIVSFPSFHAASAVLYMWALWPVRSIGGIAVALNMLMIAATPVIGAHYMIDIIGGVVLAAISILLAKYCLDIVVSLRSTSEVKEPGLVESWQPRLGNGITVEP
jgi:membrane-associated phospholipid phosphatase